MIWDELLECIDDEGNPTCWAARINHPVYGRFVWITLDNDGYHVEISKGQTYIPSFETLTVCKSLTSAKRWVARNLKEATV